MHFIYVEWFQLLTNVLKIRTAVIGENILQKTEGKYKNTILENEVLDNIPGMSLKLKDPHV